MKLLIADNDRDLVEMLTGWLKTLGYEVYRAYTGEQAARVWEEQQPDLIILDTRLKDMDGLTMCREMRSKHDALVLVVTDGKDVQDEVRCLESGADDYLRKPFQLAEFETQLARVVSHLAVRRQHAVLHRQLGTQMERAAQLQLEPLGNRPPREDQPPELAARRLDIAGVEPRPVGARRAAADRDRVHGRA